MTTEPNNVEDVVETDEGLVPVNEPETHTTKSTPEASVDTAIEPTVATADALADEDSVKPVDLTDDDDDLESRDPPEIDPTKTPFIKLSPEKLIALYDSCVSVLGKDEFTRRVYKEGSYENTLHNLLVSMHAEADREFKGLNAMSPEDLKSLEPRLRDPATGKLVLATKRLSGGSTPGDFTVSGTDAVSALINLGGGGSFRIPLFNSCLSIDAICPTNADLQNYMVSCMETDRFLGSMLGVHYFAYSDLLVKQQTLDLAKSLMSNTSMAGWNKGDTLWNTILLPDLNALYMWLAFLCYPEGFDGFIDVCTAAPKTGATSLCNHQETITARITDMIRVRWSVMNEDAVNFMVKAMMTSTKMTVEEVKAQQNAYGFNDVQITHDDCVFTMEIPTVAKHVDRGTKFLAAISNEVGANNTNGALARINIRYMNILSSWVKQVKRTNGERSVTTDDADAIIRMMEMCDDRDNRKSRNREESLVGKIESYIDRVQLTWIGYPSTPCPSCGEVEDTPSGLKTVDPLSTFFTIAAARSSQVS